MASEAENPNAQGRDDDISSRVARRGEGVIHVFWLQGMGCDGCTTSMLGAANPGVDGLMLGTLPHLPRVALHHPGLDDDSGHEFMNAYRRAVEGSLDAPYVVVVEGSIPDDQSFASEGHYAALGSAGDWPMAIQGSSRSDRPMKVSDWAWALAPGAGACIAMGTCAAFGGIPAAAGNITGSMSLMDYLGSEYRSAGGLPIITVPGCAPVGDNFTETLSHVLMYLNKTAPLPDFDALGRPTWLFEETVHRHCPKAGYYEEGVFAEEPGDNQCLVEIGCWGPVVQCNITERGAINHVGGCMVAGGPCIGCTMPGFPDKYTPFYKSPPGSSISGTTSRITGGTIRRLRRLSMKNGNTEPLWDNAGTITSAWAVAHNGEKTPLDKVTKFFYKRLQYRGTVNHASRNAHQPLPRSRDILRQKGVDLDASVPVLGERVKSREEL